MVISFGAWYGTEDTLGISLISAGRTRIEFGVKIERELTS